MITLAETYNAEPIMQFLLGIGVIVGFIAAFVYYAFIDNGGRDPLGTAFLVGVVTAIFVMFLPVSLPLLLIYLLGKWIRKKRGVDL